MAQNLLNTTVSRTGTRTDIPLHQCTYKLAKKLVKIFI